MLFWRYCIDMQTSYFGNFGHAWLHAHPTPQWKQPWQGEGAYLTKWFETNASTRRICRSDAARFD